MRTFFDSSAFAKRFIEERGSEIVEELCLNTMSLALSILCVPEVVSALNRRMRENIISRRDYDSIKARFLEEVKDVILLNITPPVIITSLDLIEKNIIRSMDALHVACAVEWKPDLFVSSDHRQIETAKKAGLPTRLID